jgi:hypothetical protein
MKPHLLNYWNTFAPGIGLEEKSFLVSHTVLLVINYALLLTVLHFETFIASTTVQRACHLYPQ